MQLSINQSPNIFLYKMGHLRELLSRWHSLFLFLSLNKNTLLFVAFLLLLVFNVTCIFLRFHEEYIFLTKWWSSTVVKNNIKDKQINIFYQNLLVKVYLSMGIQKKWNVYQYSTWVNLTQCIYLHQKFVLQTRHSSTKDALVTLEWKKLKRTNEIGSWWALRTQNSDFFGAKYSSCSRILVWLILW